MSERPRFQGAKTHYNGRQLSDGSFGLFPKMREMLDRLERDAGRVLDCHPRQSLDGYPNSSAADKESRGGGGYADPTGSVVVRILGGAPAGSVVERCFGAAHMAAKWLEEADSLRAQAIPPEKTAEDLSMWCEECVKVKDDDGTVIHELTHKDGARICQWHYRYRKAEGEWPPPDLVRAHHKQQRITQKMVDDAKKKRAS